MKLKPLFTVIVLAIIGLLINTLFFWLWVPKVYIDHFVYSLPLLYAVFGLLSTVILFVLLIVQQKNVDYVGYTFLLLTSLKMIVAYTFLRPILETDLSKSAIEKVNFLIVFIYFLAIETIVTIRILNNKQ
mgnify:CR=1 FL=1